MSAIDPKPSSLRRARHRVEAAVFQFLVWTICFIPRRVVLSFATFIGRIAGIFCVEDRRVAMANLDLAFGDSMPRARKKQLARGAFCNLSRTLFDLVRASKISRPEMMKLAEFDESQLQHIRDLQAAKKGVILIIPHFGNWELCGLAFGAAGVLITTIAEPGTNPHIDDMITDARRCTGHRIVPPRNAMLAMVRAAMRSQPVALFIDVNARRGRGGIWAEFFGVPVYQSVAAAELAIRSNGTIICCVPQPLPGDRVKVDFPAFIDSAECVSQDHAGRVRELTQKTLDYYESAIRKMPEQWLWTYKRWKRRPTKERGAFPFYSKFHPEPGDDITPVDASSPDQTKTAAASAAPSSP